VQRERLYRSVQESTDGGRLTDCLVVVWWCGKDSSQYTGVFIRCKKAGGESASMNYDRAPSRQPGSTLILHTFALGFVQITPNASQRVGIQILALDRSGAHENEK
jgi:hypothetical protein